MQLIIESLSKTYPNGVKALDNISIGLKEGMFGLLGPNGAGKSTLMRTLATLQNADCGQVTLDGMDIFSNKTNLRQQLGYLPQDFGVYPRITAEEMLEHVAQLKGINDSSDRKKLVAALLDHVNLTNDRKKFLGTYSGGMKQRFGIAQALIGNPRLIIVDEPTAGLDPTERNRFYNLLSQLGQNTIVILSTHIVEDVSSLCTQFAIVDKGKILYHGEPDMAINQIVGKIYYKTVDKNEVNSYHQRYKVISTQLKAGRVTLKIFSDHSPGADFMLASPNLEDVYFSNITGLTNNQTVC